MLCFFVEFINCRIFNLSQKSEGESAFVCSVCDKSFGKKSKLKVHIAAVVHEGKRQYQCDIADSLHCCQQGHYIDLWSL